MTAIEPPCTADDEARARLDDDGAPTDRRSLTPLPSRQCGRCRESFEGDPTLHPVAIAEWWLCPACRTALLGDKPARGGRRG